MARSASFACAAFVAFVAGCGSRSDLPAGSSDGSPGAASAAWPPRVVEGCAPPAEVPAGLAWIGRFDLDPTGAVSPSPCDGIGGLYFGARTYTVPRFALDVDEATTACYLRCMDEGACEPPEDAAVLYYPQDLDPVPFPWADPSRADYPVHSTPEKAAAFCAWRGGRLATLAELDRAAHGDEPVPCRTDLLAAWVACDAEDFASPSCETVADLLAFDLVTERPVRADARDVGPFGHYDLFGGQFEPTRTRPPTSEDEVDAMCADPPDATDPKTFGDSTVDLIYSPARRLDISLRLAIGGDEPIGSYFVIDDAYEDRVGFRCAYDIP